ncbi:hypothetical protein [Burkholderia sp. Bp8991]|uniref:hypothetical protein n=1 Tax=Burkholderia sp. Bp8991 TaxID=2184553 RepID=UPI000F5A8B00|nr:hypothetical protein [Burkholderia sp. Bp8991]RQS05136.1 hypothetical protein DIE02_17160 [Burkholderia sp. Bp8991]
MEAFYRRYFVSPQSLSGATDRGFPVSLTAARCTLTARAPLDDVPDDAQSVRFGLQSGVSGTQTLMPIK